MHRFSIALFLTVSLAAECRLPEAAPDAITRLSPQSLLDGGHYLRAEKLLEPIAKERPQDGQVAWMLSRAKAALGKLDEAMASAEAALASDAGDARYHVQVAAVSGMMAEKASILKRLSLVRRAKQELDAAVALDAANVETQWGLMMYYYAAPAMVGGDRARAQQIGEKLAASVPDIGRYYQARLAAELKDPEKAETFYKQSVAENPLLFDTVAALATHYLRARPDQAKAERWACQAVHADPTRADGWALLGRVYAMCGCWSEAALIAERSEAIDPDNLAPYFALAEAAIERGEQYDSAVTYLRKYLGQPAEGNQPSHAAARMHLGTALARLGKTAEATRELEAALELDGSLETARAELKRLK